MNWRCLYLIYQIWVHFEVYAQFQDLEGIHSIIVVIDEKEVD